MVTGAARRVGRAVALELAEAGCDVAIHCRESAAAAQEVAAAIQRELESVKELVFSEPIVEAVARIKIVLQHEGLIQSAKVRRPQLGISDDEKTRLLESYQTLKRNEFRTGGETEGARNRAVG